MFKEEIIFNGKLHVFVFDPESDDPAEGSSLVGVYDAETGAPLLPSRDAEAEAWEIADERLRVGKFYKFHKGAQS